MRHIYARERSMRGQTIQIWRLFRTSWLPGARAALEAERDAGAKLRELAARYGRSRERIRQVIQKRRRRRALGLPSDD